MMSYNESNEQQQLLEGFPNSCYRIVSPILQKLIHDFAVCKHCSGKLLLVETFAYIKQPFWKLEPHISKRKHFLTDQTRTCRTCLHF